MRKLKEMPRLKHQSGLSVREWVAWRKDITDAGGTLAVITGSFAIWHPGNLAAIREAARQASHVCVIITPASHAAPGTDPETAIPSTAVRAEMATYLRAVSLAATCPPGKAKEALARLRPYTLVECAAQNIPGTVATVARKVADRVVDLAPIAGCFTADIQKAIQDGHTPLSVPEKVTSPLPTRHDLDRFLDTGGRGRPLITVNGCFDVLHFGHLRMLAQAKKLGARLLVLVNDDESVRAYKGAGRPIFPIRFRLDALNALDAVAMAYPFSGDNPLPLLATIRPDIHVKGGSFEEVRVREERRLVESWGGRLEFIPLVNGFSTSGVVKRMIQ